jgi:uncharacterized membrane protein
LTVRSLANTSLISATVCVGLVAGLLGAFAVAIMPALRGASDRTFVETMQRINVSILNPIFLGAYMGGLLLSVAAVVLHWIDDERGALPWIIAGTVLYLVVLVITDRVNVPLNEQMDAIGDPTRATDLGAARQQFEDRWVTWNVIRSVVNVGAFVCLAVGILITG